METQEITIQSKVQDIITKSGVPFELEMTDVFNLAERGKAITSIDDENFVEVKKEMQQKRKEVTEYFEDARKEINRASKGIKSVQDLVLDEFVPQENRLKEMDKAEKERLVMEARMESLPKRKERLEAIGGEVTLPEEHIGDLDDYLLGMEDADFEIMVVQVQAAKNEADRLELEAAKAQVEADIKKVNEELAAKKAEGERIEAARQEERDRAEESLRVEKERLANEAKEIEERRVRETEEAEERRVAAVRAEEAEKARIAQEEKAKAEAVEKVKAEAVAQGIADAKAKAADVKYQAWVSGLGEGSFKFLTIEGGGVEAYKLVGTYAKE